MPKSPAMTRYITPFFISFHTSRKDLVLRTTLFLNQIITPNNKPFNQPNTSPTGMNCPKVTPAHTRSICLQCDCWLVATLKLGPPYTFELPSVEAMFLARTNWHDHLLRYLPPGKDKVPMLMDSAPAYRPGSPSASPFLQIFILLASLPCPLLFWHKGALTPNGE